MAALEIRPYSVDAIPVLLELTRTTLGDSGAVRKTEAFWRWKHEQNPFGSSYGLYSWDSGLERAAGLRILLRWQFETKSGDVLQAVRAVDTATHPEYQRQGIFSTLTRCAIDELAADGVDLIFNTPNSKSWPGYQKMGWRAVDKWPLYVRPLRPARMIGRSIFPGSRKTDFGSYFSPEILTWKAFLDRFGSALTEFLLTWEERRSRVGLHTPRNPTYLAWRYGQHPHVAYGVHVLTVHGSPCQLAGFALMRPNLRYGCREIVLAEIFLADNDLALGQELMTTLLPCLRGDYVITHHAEGTTEHTLARRSGFWRVPRRGILFAVLPLQSAWGELACAQEWDLTLGDLEIL